MTDPTPPSLRRRLRRRALRLLGWTVLAVVALVISGLLLADHLRPRGTGAPSAALAIQPAQTELDRELAPLLAQHPGQTGVIMVPNGLDAFAMRAIATRKAGRSLDLMYYMWHDDLTGRLLAREVIAAADRGVRVRLLLDDINAEGLDAQMLAMDAHPNIELRLFNAFRNRAGPARLLETLQRAESINHRMHNKAWIADGRVAVVGGRNIGEEYFSAAAEVNFRDLDLLLFGPAVAQASAVFDRYWNCPAAVPIATLHPKTAKHLRQMTAGLEVQGPEPGAEPYLARVAASEGVLAYQRQTLAPHWTTGLQVLADPPMKSRGDDQADWLIHALGDAITHAKHEALLISPYFVPGEEGTAALAKLTADGVRVGVVTNSLAANDVPAVHSGYANYRGELLAHGVAIHEIRALDLPTRGGSGLGSRGASLHTKAFVLDGQRGFVGSFNLDLRSADLNTEMGVLFDDPGLARDLRREYARLSGPTLSYLVYLGHDGRVRWLDRATRPSTVLRVEPDTDPLTRAQTRFLSLLPIESQL
jgi:putative cardiolipin synthase